jgi:hypothetical protein
MSQKNLQENGPKQLYKWAEEGLAINQVSNFLKFCKNDNHEATEMVTYAQFLTFKEKFES